MKCDLKCAALWNLSRFSDRTVLSAAGFVALIIIRVITILNLKVKHFYILINASHARVSVCVCVLFIYFVQSLY